MFSQVQESELINEKEVIGNKHKILVWKVNIKKIHDRFQRNKEIKEKECLTKINNVKTQLNVFMKLVRCSTQVQDMKMGKKINMCIKNRAHKLYSNLSEQKQFQEGYWTNKNKIVLIEYVFDAIVLKLQRQGYSYECMKKLPSLIQNHKSYPAYKKHKLKWYFHHLKEQIFNMR